MSSSSPYYLVEMHNFNPLRRRWPARRKIHSVHSTFQQARQAAHSILHMVIERLSPSRSWSPMISSRQAARDLSINESSWSTDDEPVFLGYEVTCPDGGVFAVKLRRSTSGHSGRSSSIDSASVDGSESPSSSSSPSILSLATPSSPKSPRHSGIITTADWLKSPRSIAHEREVLRQRHDYDPTSDHGGLLPYH